MKCVKIEPNNLAGEINIPPSKSLTHRVIICSGLANGVSNIQNIEFSDDIIATCKGMKSFGVEIDINKNMKTTNMKSVSIKGIDETRKLRVINEKIDCSESGSTLRFLIPLAALTDQQVVFHGKGRLIERPLDVYYKIFDKKNIEYSNENGKLPLSIIGKLKSGRLEIEGNISSQFISGLMFALPLLDGDSEIILTSKLESKGYVDLTMSVLNKYNIEIENDNYQRFFINGNQKYKSRNYKIEGDFSQAAFWIAASILGSKIKCVDLYKDSLQADRTILNILKDMNADIISSHDSVIAYAERTKGTTIDVSQCPDLVPILTVLGSLSEGTTRIINAERLRIKESDRLKAISTELNKLGGDVIELNDGLIINGKQSLGGGVVDSWGDHRIAMALAIASIRCDNPVTITNSDVVKKSYPRFWEDFRILGGKCNEQRMG